MQILQEHSLAIGSHIRYVATHSYLDHSLLSPYIVGIDVIVIVVILLHSVSMPSWLHPLIFYLQVISPLNASEIFKIVFRLFQLLLSISQPRLV